MLGFFFFFVKKFKFIKYIFIFALNINYFQQKKKWLLCYSFSFFVGFFRTIFLRSEIIIIILFLILNVWRGGGGRVGWRGNWYQMIVVLRIVRSNCISFLFQLAALFFFFSSKDRCSFSVRFFPGQKQKTLRMQNFLVFFFLNEEERLLLVGRRRGGGGGREFVCCLAPKIAGVFVNCS